ncbi:MULTISPECIES: ABC transporter permease [Thalassospira]|jgi:iron(III) transport system permease protein|uniref:ABC transporter permease n=1 Tax=Thalassospira xiamenensis TaxID=220697 RepID=A0ABR5XWI3_9PROT|nr:MULTISPECIES: iron ABC transporter permease [Thalassospira]MBL4840122.1 iron ABC transporter permease [Thalassospira sp.]MBR9815427.1 iron ABC transporter permease [Rhodospirillales bacterium]KZC96686.1 ABC transporter permease [Thalassospira xiamenensis]KZD04309.1 ABC transporter permease [Thalassospira xiamenensis]MCD1594570.1 iron ABC transporter permease [Thalassospira xiamenensis]|tara:strand:+ start:94827 stop:96563 length:1737 start_codon:yes stop_codon:yes gene_type:complete
MQAASRLRGFMPGFASPTVGNRSSDRLLPWLLLPVFVISILPIARLAIEGVFVGGVPSADYIRDVLGSSTTWRATANSLYTAGLGTIISLLIGGAFAFLVALTDIRAKAVLVFCFMIPMMIPPQITALAWVQLTGPSSALLNALGMAPPMGSPQPFYSAEGIALLLGIQHASIVFLTLRANLRMLPREQIEAARLAGARGGRLWWQIILPLTSPGLIAGTAMAFVTALGNFGIPAMLGIPANYSTLPTLIYQKLAGFGPSVLGEVSVLAMLIGMIAILGVAVHHRLLGKRDYRLMGMVGRPLDIRLGARRTLVEAVLWAVLMAILVIPLMALVATALVPAFGVKLSLANYSFDAFYEVLFVQPSTIRAFHNSFMLSVGAAVTLVAICLPLAYVIVRRPTRLTHMVNLLVEVPYALPGVVLAIACILLFIRIPVIDVSLYGTLAIIFVAYLARFLVIALRPVMNSFSQLDPALEEAAQACGAGLGRRLRDILLPLAAPSAAAGALLVFLTAFNELTVSALLWSAGNETLGVLIFNLDDSGDTVLASAVAVLVVLVVIALMTGFQLASRRLPKGVVPWQT